MEGVCDMFNNDDEEFESNKYKLKQVEFGPIKIFEMDNGEDNVLIGQSLWKGSKVMSKWLMKVNPQMCEGKNVLELGSGIGLCGFTASYFVTDHECDKLIDSIAPEVVEDMIRFGVNKGLR